MLGLPFLQKRKSIIIIIIIIVHFIYLFRPTVYSLRKSNTSAESWKSLIEDQTAKPQFLVAVYFLWRRSRNISGAYYDYFLYVTGKQMQMKEETFAVLVNLRFRNLRFDRLSVPKSISLVWTKSYYLLILWVFLRLTAAMHDCIDFLPPKQAFLYNRPLACKAVIMQKIISLRSRRERGRLKRIRKHSPPKRN